MTVQTIPYALQNASHSAALFRQSASSPWSTGGAVTTGELPIAAQTTPNMSIRIGAGRGKVVGTSVSPPNIFGVPAAFTTQGMYDVLNDASFTVTVAASDPTNPRIDLAYIQVQDSFYSGASNVAVAGIVTGTPAVSPVAPALPANAILLGYVAVAANATSIVSGNISTTGVTTASLVGTPYAFATGLVTAATNNTGVTVVTFPAGRFTVAPETFCTMSNFVANGTLYTASVTASQMTVQTYNVSTGANVTSIGFKWFAIQATPTTAAG